MADIVLPCPPAKLPSLKDIERIVINKISVFELEIPVCTEDETPFWRKTDGGPGFQSNHNPRTCKNRCEMHAYIRRRLAKMALKVVYRKQGVTVSAQEPAYRWWKSGKTLNIKRIDLP